MDSNEYLVEDEINLRDYIDVILKYKWLIIAIVLVSTIITGVLSFSVPKVYEVSMTIEPGYIGITEEGKFIYIDSTENIKTKIEKGIFDSKIINKLNLDDKKVKLKFNIDNPKNSELIKISLKKVEGETNTGINILNQLYAKLSENYKEIVEFKKDDIDKKVYVFSSNIKNYKNDILLQEENLKILKQREESLITEIDKVNINTTKLLSNREDLFNKKDEDGISSLLYTNTIQQNISYLNQLNNQMFNLRERGEGITSQIKRIKNDIEDLTVKIESLNSSKNYVHSVKIIQEPKVSPYPVAPKKKQKVAIAGMASLMFAVFLVFFIEFMRTSKPSDKNRKQLQV